MVSSKEPNEAVTRRNLRSTLMSKTWFAFDLDDTLHEFRKASGKAVDATLHQISTTVNEKHLSIDDLKAEYTNVLRQKTSSAFVDGKTSLEYRAERFSAVLQNLGVQSVPEAQMQHFLVTYEETLMRALELKDGVLDLFKTLKAAGKKIIVITEGPQDAQLRTVDALGLSRYIDFLATTNHFRVSKIEGLYHKVLEELQIHAEDMVMIGDNFQRDVEPAVGVGIFAIYYSEKEECVWDARPPKVNALKELESILSGE